MWLVVALPFALALVAPWLLPRLGRAAGLAAALVPLLVFAFLLADADDVARGASLGQAVPWVEALGLELALRADGLALVFALLISGFGALIFVYAGAYFEGDPRLPKLLAYLALFQGSMLGLVLADDVVLLFVFWELTSVSSYLLIAFDAHDEKARKAALQALLVTGGGGLALLAGLVLLASVAGTFELGRIADHGEAIRTSALALPIVVLVLAGAFTKSAQVPFHFWLPGAMAAPTPVSAYLHSATMVKAGVYLVLRLQPVFAPLEDWSLALQIVGAATFVVGACLAVGQTDLKRLLAYSTVSALGSFVLLVGIGTEAAVRAAIVAIVAHALYKGALFLCAGAIDHEAGTRDVTRLGGLLRAMPRTGVAALAAGASMAGLPPLLGFVSKELTLTASLPTPWILACVVAGSALTVVAAMRVAWEPFLARKPSAVAVEHEPGAGLWIAPLVLATCGLAFVLVPGFVEPLLARAASDAMGRGVLVDLAPWHGVTIELALSGLAIVLGLAGYALRDRLVRAGGGLAVLTRVGPERAYASVVSETLAFGSGLAQRVQGGRLRVYVGVCVVALAALGTAGLVLDRERLELHLVRPVGPIGLALACLIVLGAVSTATTRSRLAAVAALGAVGYGVALLYLVYGAPDLAMTQFAIETLGVLLFVLVLRRLPKFVPHGAPFDRTKHLIVACTGGVFMGALSLAASPPALSDRLSRWFAERAYPEGHGRNVVNVILVEFRALDTLGEITVLGAAGIAVFALVKLRSREAEDA